MAEPFDSLARRALELPVTQRSELADKLIESLDHLSAEELDQLWALEGERRYEAYRAGRIEAIPGDEVHRQIFEEPE